MNVRTGSCVLLNRLTTTGRLHVGIVFFKEADKRWIFWADGVISHFSEKDGTYRLFAKNTSFEVIVE